MTKSSPSELAESIRDGSYFEESRKFYSEVYLSIISERVFYLVLTALSLMTVLIALSALLRLMPLSPTQPFLLRTTDAVHNLPLMTRLSQETSEPPDAALRRFLVTQYIKYREGYTRDKIAMHARAIYYWSTRENYETYKRSIDTNNPRSPVVKYESNAERDIVVTQTKIEPNPSEGENAYIANVDFVAYVIRLGKIESSTWSAEMRFEYTDVDVDQDGVDEKTGKMIVKPMKFVVSSFNVIERKEENPS